MEYNRREKGKYVIFVFIIFITFLLFACALTFLIDIENNKSIIPLIFFIFLFYSIFLFLYYLLYVPIRVMKGFEINFKTKYLVFFIINLLLFILSCISLWL